MRRDWGGIKTNLRKMWRKLGVFRRKRPVFAAMWCAITKVRAQQGKVAKSSANFIGWMTSTACECLVAGLGSEFLNVAVPRPQKGMNEWALVSSGYLWSVAYTLHRVWAVAYRQRAGSFPFAKQPAPIADFVSRSGFQSVFNRVLRRVGQIRRRHRVNEPRLWSDHGRLYSNDIELE